MIDIRKYNYFSDYRMIEAWLSHYDQECPPDSMFPMESTFIASVNNKDLVIASIYFTNAKPLAYIENFIGNPNEKGDHRKEATKCLLQHLKNVAKDNGAKILIAFPLNEKLASYYKDMGFENDLGVHSVLATRTD